MVPCFFEVLIYIMKPLETKYALKNKILHRQTIKYLENVDFFYLDCGCEWYGGADVGRRSQFDERGRQQRVWPDDCCCLFGRRRAARRTRLRHVAHRAQLQNRTTRRIKMQNSGETRPV